MALNMGQPRRHRSSTAASRGLNADERNSTTAELVQKLVGNDKPASGNHSAQGILDDLRREFVQSGSSKDLFRHAKGFETLLQLLQSPPATVEQDLAGHGKLVKTILVTLSESLKDHRGNKRYFASYLKGWKDIEGYMQDTSNFVLALNDPTKSATYFSDLLDGLLALAVGNTHAFNGQLQSGKEDRDQMTSETLVHQVLRNPEACSIAVRLSILLIRKIDDQDEDRLTIGVRALLWINSIVESSNRNRVALWQTNALTHLLPTVLDGSAPTGARNVLDNLCLSLSSVGLRSLHDVELLFKRSCDSENARQLLLHVLRESKGPPFIQFDLSFCGYSSIELPSLPRVFPPSNGYTFTAWVRVDEFDSACHTTLFGAFDSSQTCFILTYLEKDSRQLILQTSVRSQRPSVRFKSTRFVANRGYHVALVHKKNEQDPEQSSAILFVDGEFAEQVKCGYPRLPPELDDKDAPPSPSPNVPPPARYRRPVQAFLGTPHDLGLRLTSNPSQIKVVFSRRTLISSSSN